VDGQWSHPPSIIAAVGAIQLARPMSAIGLKCTRGIATQMPFVVPSKYRLYEKHSTIVRRSPELVIGIRRSPYRMGQELLVDVKEAARRLGFGRSFVYSLIVKGDLPSIKISGARRVAVVDLEAFVNRMRDEAGADG
jgi:excisionase family DNA binding protein